MSSTKILEDVVGAADLSLRSRTASGLYMASPTTLSPSRGLGASPVSSAATIPQRIPNFAYTLLPDSPIKSAFVSEKLSSSPPTFRPPGLLWPSLALSYNLAASSLWPPPPPPPAPPSARPGGLGLQPLPFATTAESILQSAAGPSYPGLWFDFQRKCQLMLEEIRRKELMLGSADDVSSGGPLQFPPLHLTSVSSPVGPTIPPPLLTAAVPTTSQQPSPSRCSSEECCPSLTAGPSSPGSQSRVPPTGTMTSETTPRFRCSTCKRSYSTHTGLRKHREQHCLGETGRQYSCQHCSKLYHSMSALKMHIRTHTLPCKCTLCGKAFSRMWLLNGHIRTHTGEKPFSCQVCARAFADRSNLRAHMQTHSEVKRYRCSACDKTFSRMGLLTKHRSAGCGQAQQDSSTASEPGSNDGMDMGQEELASLTAASL